MSNDIIGMDDMMAIFEITDLFGIDRENISVPLEKEGVGSVISSSPNGIEITVPTSIPINEWLPTLQGQLTKLGFKIAQCDEW